MLHTTDRRGTDALKWTDKPECPLPMWVADMDFQTAPCVIEALRRRVEHGVFGYVKVPEAYYATVRRWFAERHGWRIEERWVQYVPGVVPALSAIIKAMCKPGDGVVVMTPVYNCFYSSIRNNGCRVVGSKLRREGDTYTIDYADLEAKASEAKLLLLCNPHNPVGRCWTREELTKVSEIAQRKGLFVVSDEIHCELVMPGHAFVPYGTIASSNCAICTSPSKAFNTAGLQIANIICADESIRRRIDRAININEVCDVNPFGVCALQAAYTDEGYEWLTALRQHIHSNYEFLRTSITQRMPSLRLTPLEATYLAWIDCQALRKPSRQIADELLALGLWLNPGALYDTQESPFLRMNLACSRDHLAQALDILHTYVTQHTTPQT